MRHIDSVSRELICEPEDVDRGVAVKGLEIKLSLFYEAIMPKCMLSGFVTDEQSHRRKPLLRYLYLFGVDGMTCRKIPQDA